MVWASATRYQRDLHDAWVSPRVLPALRQAKNKYAGERGLRQQKYVERTISQSQIRDIFCHMNVHYVDVKLAVTGLNCGQSAVASSLLERVETDITICVNLVVHFHTC